MEASSLYYIAQRPKLDKEQFCLLEVKKSNMRMSSFIKQKLGSFENGRAFYEFTDEEDFLHYKEVVNVQKSQVQCMLSYVCCDCGVGWGVGGE